MKNQTIKINISRICHLILGIIETSLKIANSWSGLDEKNDYESY